MSLNFSDLGKKEKEIRCIVTQKFNKKVKVYYDNFDEVKEKFGLKIVTIYEPSTEQKEKIMNLINESIKENVDKTEISINGDKFLLELLEELTDIELNLDYDNEKDRKQIEKILKQPSRLLLAVHSEITEICNEIFDMMYNNLVSFAERPEGIRQAMLYQYDNQVKKQEKVEDVDADESMMVDEALKISTTDGIVIENGLIDTNEVNIAGISELTVQSTKIGDFK